MGGRNYNDTTRDGRPDDARFLGMARSAQAARCARGEHEETEARRHYVTYVGGRRLPEGARYCRACEAILPDAQDGEG